MKTVVSRMSRIVGATGLALILAQTGMAGAYPNGASGAGPLWAAAPTPSAGSLSPLANSPAPGITRLPANAPRLEWRPCAGPGQQNFDCATARVPLSYTHPRGRKISLAVVRHEAADQADRIGALFFNPGGPGQPGKSSLMAAIGLFPEQLRDRFDLVSWDPRGVGESTAVQCFANQDVENRFLSGFSTIPVGRAQEQELISANAKLARKCARRSGRLLRHVSTADTARDLDLLRAAVGDPKLNYLGVSYGTFLGATYANLFPDRVRALVLDGDVNPEAFVGTRPRADGMFLGTSLRQKSDIGTAKTMNAFLGLCGRAEAAECAFSAGSAAATRAKFTTLVKQMRRHSLRPRGGYTYAQLLEKTVNTIYNTASWAPWAQVLQDVWVDRVPVRAAQEAKKYGGLEQALAVICSESPNPQPSTFPAQATLATDRSGPTGSYWAWTSEACGTWPAVAAHGYTGPWNRRTASPVLVIGTTHDPSTPYHNSVILAHTLARARLLTVQGYGHTALTNPSTCVIRYESRYFIDGELPPVGTTCRQDLLPFSGGS